MKRGVHAYFSGRVQGVFFRANIQKKAEQLGIAGWVRNRDDGRVEVFAEGEEKLLMQIMEFCRKYAQITAAEISWKEFRGENKGFEIRL